jgi:uncharacterized protein YybS (DUF2232 family)
VSRRLSAIEIAEGALLADVAIVLQLVAIYVPIGGHFLRLLIPTAFAVLVLRRGLRVGAMALCVTLFVVAVMTGVHFLATVLIECAAGLFLGVTMRGRLPHLATILLGTTGATLAFTGLLALGWLLIGLPIAHLIDQLRQSALQALAVGDLVAPRLGLASWWHSVEPQLAALVRLALDYWWAVWLGGTWVVLLPVVIAAYFVTNVCVRLLGYDVRPFPGGRLERRARRVARALARQARRRGLIGKVGAAA